VQRCHRVRVVAALLIVVGACAHSAPPATCGAGFGPLSSEHSTRTTDLSRLPITWITSVRVAGVDRELARRLVRPLATRPGMLLVDAPLKDDLRALWKSGVIDDARVELEGEGSVVFAVTLREPIQHVTIRGADRKTARRFRLLEGAAFEPARIQRMVEAAKLAYVREGRLEASVVAKRARARDGVAVCVAADPGPRLTIRALRFPGRTAVPAATLIAALRGADAKVNHVGGTFDRDALLTDEVLLKVEYWNRGYADVKIGEPRAHRKGDRLIVDVPIVEGPRFRLGRVATNYAIGVPLGVETGEVFDRSKIAAARDRLQEMTGAASVMPMTKLDSVHETIDLTFELEWKWPWDAFRSWR